MRLKCKDVYKRQDVYLLGQETLQFTTVYIDDLLITSSNWDEHCTRVEQVLRKLSENNVTLKLNKSKFIANKVKFLGFNLTEMGIRDRAYVTYQNNGYIKNV